MITFNNYNLTFDNKWLYHPRYRSSLPPFTIRIFCRKGSQLNIDGATYTLVSDIPAAVNWDIWDVCTTGGREGDWSGLLKYGGQPTNTVIESFTSNTQLYGVIDANTTGVTNMSNMFLDNESLATLPMIDTYDVTDMSNMFAYCRVLYRIACLDTRNVTNMSGMFMNCSMYLSTVPLLDTRKVTNMLQMFSNCQSLIAVPKFDTSNVVDMRYMLSNCYNVESGALALYQRASSQANPPTNHERAFYNCGSNTVTGAAELAQIPSDWK